LERAPAVILGVAAQKRGSSVGGEAGAFNSEKRFPLPNNELRPVKLSREAVKLKGGWVVMSLPALNALLS